MLRSNLKSNIRVAMIAPPWLSIPPAGYGGVENVIYGLIPELRKLGVKVELFTTGDTTLPSTKTHWLYPSGQYKHIHRPQYDSLPISVAHMLFALNKIKADGHFDLIHDHNSFVGPLALSQASEDLPPTIHTLHNPQFTVSGHAKPESLLMWQQIAKSKNLYLVGISESVTKNAPRVLKPIMLPYVHNAIDYLSYPFVAKKGNYFMTLGRFHPEKGQDWAVRACVKLGEHLKMAGIVGDLADPAKVLMELANPLSAYRSSEDFRYYSDSIFPHLLGGMIENVGEVRGARKLRLLGRAKALLFPAQWEEPFGMVAIEALACGTPVIATPRGALPEIIKHGVNGFLVKTEAELRQYMRRIGEIDPLACRQSVEQNFSAARMAQQYLANYQTVLARQAA